MAPEPSAIIGPPRAPSPVSEPQPQSPPPDVEPDLTPFIGERKKATLDRREIGKETIFGQQDPLAALGSALNLKENVYVKVENCLFRDNEIAVRVRGQTKRGGAEVAIKNCAIYLRSTFSGTISATEDDLVNASRA